MIGASTLLVTAVVTGLAGSLHCVGMCGPILLGFAPLFARRGATSLTLDFAGYHAGRIWTYVLLGAAAGWLGSELQGGAAILGWQRPVGIAAGVLVVVVGVTLLRVVPGLGLDRFFAGCGLGRVRDQAWFRGLVASDGIVARLLLGVAMGLLPCGLVYGMLAVVAAAGSPLLGAAAMASFGLGTLPALSAVIAASRHLPAWVRRHGTRLAAIAILAAGGWMIVRAATVDVAGCHPSHAAHADQAR